MYEREIIGQLAAKPPVSSLVIATLSEVAVESHGHFSPECKLLEWRESVWSFPVIRRLLSYDLMS